MAKGCVKYDIQEYVHPIGWESRLEQPFRARSDDEALARYETFTAGWSGGNLRLVRINVIEQCNYSLKRIKEMS